MEVLASASVIAAEDTRVAQRLLAGLHVETHARLVTVNEHTERARIAELLDAAREGDVVLVSDAGMPTVSDPGFAVVRAAVDAGVPVTAVPGASAVLTALALSGLPTDRFVFEGFPPRKPGERRRFLQTLARRAAHDRAVRVAEPDRVAARGDGRGVRARPAGRRRAGADEVLRGGRARHGRRGRGVGGGRRPRRGRRGARGRAAGRGRLGRRARRGARARRVRHEAQGRDAEVADRTGLSRKALYDAALAARKP